MKDALGFIGVLRDRIMAVVVIGVLNVAFIGQLRPLKDVIGVQLRFYFIHFLINETGTKLRCFLVVLP